MSRLLGILAIVLLFAPAGSARADVAVLVHGYLGDGASWESSGVIAELSLSGWRYAGNVVHGPSGPALPNHVPDTPNTVYTVELPSTAPLAMQADVLAQTVRALEVRHRGEPIALVGHSAGGVVGRMVVVRDVGQVRRLITIASPHLGTERALQALDLTHAGGPLNIFKDMFGGRTYHTVKQSWPVLLDLAPAQPGTTLYWLNGQPHPAIEYVSIVRNAPYGIGDGIVPAYSQDMNNLPRLRGRARSIPVSADHLLGPQDGKLLARILASR
jgi:pimeloyl-ACP methyl ester carboxylesterase